MNSLLDFLDVDNEKVRDIVKGALVSLLAFTAAIVLVIVFCNLIKPSEGMVTKPGIGMYTVLQQHNGGQTLQVEHDGKIFILEYTNETITDEDEAKGPWPYEPGEVLTLQLMCMGWGRPYFYKELEDGTGEREYTTGVGYYDLDQKFCPE